MTTTYTWLVEYMSCYPQADGETDVVFIVGWRCNAQDVVITDKETTYKATQYGTVNVTYVSGEPYTPYADLTQDQVLGWVWTSGVDQAAVEASLAKNLEDQVNPPVVTPPLPWSA
jgi:hypothetical protein